MNIIVTGAGKGIGYAIVKKLSQNNEDKVVAISRNIEKLKNDHFKNVNPVSLDINKLSLSEIDFQYFENKKIDILINNAGVLINKAFKDFKYDEIKEMFNTNVISAALFTQQLIPHFNPEGTHVVNIGSMGGYQGSKKFPGLSFYSASKAALAILTECLSAEYSKTAYKFNCLALGAVQTEMLSLAFPGYKTDLTPDEMADYIIDFAKNAHKFINGKIIPVSVINP